MRILLLAEFLVASQSAVILVLGEDSESPSSADVEFLVAVSVTFRFLNAWVVGPVQNPRPGGPVDCSFSGMVDTTRTSRGPASKALRLLGAHKPPHRMEVII